MTISGGDLKDSREAYRAMRKCATPPFMEPAGCSVANMFESLKLQVLLQIPKSDGKPSEFDWFKICECVGFSRRKVEYVGMLKYILYYFLLGKWESDNPNHQIAVITHLNMEPTNITVLREEKSEYSMDNFMIPSIKGAVNVEKDSLDTLLLPALGSQSSKVCFFTLVLLYACLSLSSPPKWASSITFMAVGTWPKSLSKKKSAVVDAWKAGGATFVKTFRKNLVSLVIVPRKTRYKSVLIASALGCANITFVDHRRLRHLLHGKKEASLSNGKTGKIGCESVECNVVGCLCIGKLCNDFWHLPIFALIHI